ncbi:hypothetical protein D3C83_78270 [compost metagenome]
MHTGHGVETDGCVEVVHGLEERNEFLGMKRSVSHHAGNDDAVEPEFLHRAPGLYGRCGRILNRH